MTFIKSQNYLQRYPASCDTQCGVAKESKFPRDYRLALPRPEVIQNLSIFTGCLEWVRPTEGELSIFVVVRRP